MVRLPGPRSAIRLPVAASAVSPDRHSTPVRLWLKSLDDLRIDDNQVSDLGPLANLTTVGILTFERNKVADLGPLVRMTGLSQVDFSANLVKDLSPLLSSSLRYVGGVGNPLSCAVEASVIDALRKRNVTVEVCR
jgi:Leucine-rich repeat (LRR) protein